MSTDNEGISDSTKDRITKVPDGLASGSGKKEKDPKKVAAGKALAEKNKRAREALRREEEREAANAVEKELGESDAGQRPDGSSWMPEISFSNVLTVIGIGLTIVSFYREYKNQKITSKSGTDHGQMSAPRSSSPSARGFASCEATSSVLCPDEESKTQVRTSAQRLSKATTPKKIGME